LWIREKIKAHPVGEETLIVGRTRFYCKMSCPWSDRDVFNQKIHFKQRFVSVSLMQKAQKIFSLVYGDKRHQYFRTFTGEPIGSASRGNPTL